MVRTDLRVRLTLSTKHLTETGFGIPYERPITRLREFLTALRQLTETGGADFHGELLAPLPAGPRALAEHIVPAVTAAAEAAGRPAPRIVAFVPGVVTADVEAVREKATESLAFYEQFPSYQRVIGLSGATRAADLAVIGDEDRRRTWKLLGESAVRS